MERPARFAGESKWLGMSIFAVISQASRSILAYSSRPLMWVSALGITLSVSSIIVMFGVIVFG